MQYVLAHDSRRMEFDTQLHVKHWHNPTCTPALNRCSFTISSAVSSQRLATELLHAFNRVMHINGNLHTQTPVDNPHGRVTIAVQLTRFLVGKYDVERQPVY